MSARLLGAKRFNKTREIPAGTIFKLSAHCSPFVIFKVLALPMRKLITARAALCALRFIITFLEKVQLLHARG